MSMSLTNTAGKDYRLQEPTVVLHPDTNQTGYVHFEILEGYFEVDIAFVVHLMILPGYKASLNYSMATVVIKGGQSKSLLYCGSNCTVCSTKGFSRCYCQWQIKSQ